MLKSITFVISLGSPSGLDLTNAQPQSWAMKTCENNFPAMHNAKTKPTITNVITRFLLSTGLLALVGCATPNRLVYSSGFSFANYDFLMISKPDSNNTSTTLYGMDVEFANLVSRYNIRVIGDKEYLTFPSEAQKRTLNARISITAGGKKILFTVSFDDSVTGKTGASITTYTSGDIFDPKARTKCFERASETIVRALQQDKGLIISNDRGR